MNRGEVPGDAPALSLYGRDVERCVRDLRAFVTQTRIDALRKELAVLDADGNWFRTLAREEDLPWLAAFDELDGRTMRGARPLRPVALSRELMVTAYAGRVLQTVLPTLPGGQRERMAKNLLDYRKSRGASVLMEWDVATFYLLRGFRVHWNDRGEQGYEFRADGNGQTFDVECKRISRRSKDRLDFRGAAILGKGFIDMLKIDSLCGHIICDTHLPLVNTAADVAAAFTSLSHSVAAEPAAEGVATELGTVSWNVAAIPAKQDGNRWREARQRKADKPHDHRAFMGPVPSEGAPFAPVLVLIRGPRFTQEEHAAHIKATVLEAAGQLSGTVPGLIFIDVEDVCDVTLFRDKAVFRESAAEAFATRPSTAAVIWRTEPSMIGTHYGWVSNQNVFVDWNPACAFADTQRIPVLGVA